MAPDSQRVREVCGSVMAGTRPLGLRDSKGSVRGFVLLVSCWMVFVFVIFVVDFGLERVRG